MGVGMTVRKRAVRVVAVLAIAIATGQAVEHIRISRQPAVMQMVQGDAPTADLPEVRGITAVSAQREGSGQPGCAVSMSLGPAPLAMVDLVLAAPCNRGERVVIRYSGLSFTSVTGSDGMLRLQLPAMEASMLIAAYLDGSEVVLGKVESPDVAVHPRLAIVMSHPAHFDLRALEGEVVHVGASAPRAEAANARVQILGVNAVADPIITQIYSFPGSDLTASDLSVELRITPETCGRTLPMTSVLAHEGRIARAERAVTVPLCGTSGDILVLKNLLDDLALAAPM